MEEEEPQRAVARRESRRAEGEDGHQCRVMQNAQQERLWKCRKRQREMAARKRRRARRVGEEENQRKSRPAPRMQQTEAVQDCRTQQDEGLERPNQWKAQKTRKPRAMKMANCHS